jgi:biotin carboxyl carrier protein
MLDVSRLLETIKAAPYEEVVIRAPHTGVVKLADIKEGDKVSGPTGVWKDKPGSLLASITRERNTRPIASRQKGVISGVCRELEDRFVEAGTPLVTLRHFLGKDEVLQIILRHALYLFPAPERAKYYFTPAVDLKVKVSGSASVTVTEGMELFIMSRMKREMPLYYLGPEGVIYAVYFLHNQNMEAGQPLIGVCPQDHLKEIEDVVLRVQTEWEEQE